MEPGEVWAYRKRAIDPLEPVTYLRHRRGGGRKDKYSLVRFESEDADGREEWVPDGRLKCPWDQAESYEAEERKWIPVIKESMVGDGIKVATSEVLELTLPDEMWGDLKPPAHLADHGEMWLAIAHIEELSELCKIPVDELCGDPTAFEQDGEWVVPAAITLKIAERLAPLAADRLIQNAERDERKLEALRREHALRFPHADPWPSDTRWWEELDESIRLRRQWVGRDNNLLRQSATKAEAEAERLRNLVEWAINKLDGYGHKSSAETLRKHLNDVVE